MSRSGYQNGSEEKAYHNHSEDIEHLDESMDHGTALKRLRTASSIAITPELFEKLYLSPQTRVSGKLRTTFANPTPVALTGFLLSLTPLSCMLMGWRGAGGTGGGAANIGAYLFFGGLLMTLGGVGEFIVGNTFPCVTFLCFGAFWLTFGSTLIPQYNAYTAYSPTGNPQQGLASAEFSASFAFFLLWMGMFCLIFTVLALRTNFVFFMIFLLLTIAFGILAGAYWQVAEGNATSAATLQKAGGGILFVICLLGWWILAAVMAGSTDFPLNIPVGDLSQYIKGASERAKAKQDALAA